MNGDGGSEKYGWGRVGDEVERVSVVVVIGLFLFVVVMMFDGEGGGLVEVVRKLNGEIIVVEKRWFVVGLFFYFWLGIC